MSWILTLVKGANILQYVPQIHLRSSLTMKQSAVVVASIAGIATVVSAAVYFRRKRHKNFLAASSDDCVSEDSTNSKRKSRRKNNSANASLNRTKLRRSKRHRNTSVNTTFTSSSTASSVHNSRWIDAENYDQVEALYQEGVDALENAIHKWEKASSLLHSTSVSKDSDAESVASRSWVNGDAETPQPPKSHRRTSSLDSPPLKQPNQYPLGRSSSFSAPRLVTGKNTTLSQSEGDLDGLLTELRKSTNNKDKNLASFEEQLNFIVERAQRLQESFESLLFESERSSDSDNTLTGFSERPVSDADSESNESYVSARESLDTFADMPQARRMYFYEKAMEDVEHGVVVCRTMRCEMLHCNAEKDFLAKLHCVRQAFDTMLQDVSVRSWMIESGRALIECILCAAERNIAEFRSAFSRMIDFVNEPNNWPKIEEELKTRGVVQMSFYDIVLDFLIMDALDDLSHPPGGFVSILQNRWLAEPLKESALHAAVWSILKAKRNRLAYSDGFVAHMYDISEQLSPVLAWGFLGPEGKLKDVCERFREEVYTFLKRLFSFHQVRYTTRSQMADDILKMTRRYIEKLLSYMRGQVAKDGVES